MFGCKDPIVKQLNKLHYNVVRLPRTGIEPLDVVGQDGDSTERIGRLDQIWASPNQVPLAAPRPEIAANVEVKTTEKLKLSIGFSLLKPVLAALGVDVPKLKAAYQGVRRLRFEFGDMEVRGVDLLPLGTYLAAGDLNEASPVVDRYFLSGAGRAYLITEVLLSGSVTITAEDEHGTEAALNAKLIQGAVGAELTVETGSATQGIITYKGARRLAIGFKAFEVLVDEGLWAIRGIKPSLELGAVAATAGAEPTIFDPESLTNLRG